jgi:serine/threonine protein phosphatase 1
VFGLLQKRSAKPRNRTFSVPSATRVYAIGDIHGCLDQLWALLDVVRKDIGDFGGQVHLVFVGDFIDRGPDSAGVIDLLSRGDLPGQHHRFLMGNHEEAMLQVLDDDTESMAGWLRFGGVQTVESYGISRADVYRLGLELPAQLRQVVPQSHVAFLRSLEDQVRIGDYLFVHAGIRPGTPLHEQEQFDLRWIRHEFLADEDTDHGVMVVHGHTISAEPQMRANRIGIDTGCYSSGKLTALALEGSDRRFLST